MSRQIKITCAYKKCGKVKTAYASQYFKKKRFCNSTCYQKSIKVWKPERHFYAKHSYSDEFLVTL